MQQNPSPHTSRHSPSKTLFLLSGERTSISSAEAAALARMQDVGATIEAVEERIILASGQLEPDEIAKRIAFSRRVGVMLPDGTFESDQMRALRESDYRISIFELRGKTDSSEIISETAERIGGRVSLDNPTYEITIVRGNKDYYALTRPSLMKQDWAMRRPRKRAFFHPAAIFPKLSRALVNLSRVRVGETFLDPFCGTGSLLLEANEIGASPVGWDVDRRMVRGALSNMLGFRERWLGLLRADSNAMPLRQASAIATDVPYGRASSTAGSDTASIMNTLVSNSGSILDTGRRLVIMHPKHVPVDSGSRFELEEEHHLYIHRKLTRTISVLRRV